jgi:hypothetical protein
MKITTNFKCFYKSFILRNGYRFLMIKLFNFLKSIQNFNGPFFLVINNIIVSTEEYDFFI